MLARAFAAILAAFLVIEVSGCAGPGGPETALAAAKPQNAKSNGYAAPANYRQLIVTYLKATHYAPHIRRALISRPYEEWLGLVNGGHRPAVCVEVYRETPLFSEGRDIWIFGFENGAISSANMAYPGPGCKDLSPLNEVVSPR